MPNNYSRGTKYCDICGHADEEHESIIGKQERSRVNICIARPSAEMAEATGMMRCTCDGWQWSGKAEADRYYRLVDVVFDAEAALAHREGE